MTNVVPFRPAGKKRQSTAPQPARRGKRQLKTLFFDRQEFSGLLSLYSAQVAKGNWRDYAVDFLPGQALFSAYRHAHEAPVLTISKQVQANGKGREFILFAGPRRLARGSNLQDLTPHIQAAAGKI